MHNDRIEAETGLIIPNYVFPMASPTQLSPGWQSVVTAASHYPGLPVWMIANASNGANDNFDTKHYDRAIGLAQVGRIDMLGYVATGHGNKDLGAVCDQIDRWLGDEPFPIQQHADGRLVAEEKYVYTNKVQGIFLDEADHAGYTAADGSQASFNAYYRAIRDHIRTRYPAKLVVANPGRIFDPSFVRTGIDVFVGHENSAWPTERQLQTLYDLVGGVPGRLSVMAHSQPSPPSLSAINAARGKVKFMVAAPHGQGADGAAWNSPISDSYLDVLFQRLSAR
jgi:hypothetical protein